MNNVLKRFLSVVLSAAMVFSSVAFVNISAVMADGSSYISEEGGWLESAYVEWTSVPNATGFAAYVKKANDADSSYVKLDNELIRKYPTYFRADAVGLAAGQYVMKVVPYINGALDESAAFVSGTLDVKANDRSGSAFSSKSPYYGKGVGAYNNDGTLKSDAQVVYVTKDTAKTVKADIITGKNGSSETITGFQSIIDAKQKGLDTRPLDFRIIGTIEKNDLDHISSSAEGLQVKGKNAGAELNITIEGIGEDAVIRGFGILCRNVGNVELRNFAVMLCMDDSISVDTDNNTLWIHNLDLFYGSTGGDADQAKGDGTVDVKGKSNFVTVSYNHFWDSGKSSLCGMGSEVTSSHITYHHNWFDHSDSRHPRIRVQSVHIYNNYFDGNAKYGVGVTLGSSAFVESNYFRNCKHPMMSSKQGSDIMENDKTGVADFSAKGTFSGENGGVIKAYNNHIEGSDADKFNGGVEPVYYDATATGTNGKATQFDAYLATTRDEKVPSTVKALAGGSSYNNFDTDTSNFDLGVDEANITPVEDVPSVVTKYAGRVNGGDFKNDKSKYTVLNDDKSYAVDTVLKAALSSYTSSLVSVGGLDAGGEVDTTVSTETTTEVTTEKTSEVTTEKVSETTTEKATETTTSNSTPVEIGEAQTGFVSDNTSDTGAGVSVTFNSATNKWTLSDSSTTAAAEIKIPFATQSKGKVIISGSVEPSTTASKWAFVQILGTKADGTKGEVFGFGGGANKTDLSARVNAGAYTKFGTFTAKNYDYTAVIDLDNKTVELTVDGVKSTYTGLDAESIEGVYSTTSKKGERNVSLSVPYVGVIGDAVETTTVAEPSTETTTVEKTTVDETSSETTTENVTPDPDFVYGDVDGNGERNIKDVNLLIEQIRNGAVNVIKGINDVNNDGVVDTADVATLLQKVLNSNFKMPCEPNVTEPTTVTTTVATTEATTETTTVATTEATTETTTVATTETTTEAPTEAPVVEPTTVATTVAPTTEATTVEPTTVATTEATTTEATTEASYDDSYDFENSPAVTKDGTSGITYTVSTKDGQTSDNATAEAVITDFGGSKALFLNDTSATDSIKAVVPVAIKNKGVTTYALNITPTVAKGNWTIFMLDGVKADGTEGEVLGLRIDKSKNYGLRVNAGSAVTSSGVAVTANTTINVVITVDFDNDTATLSVNGSTPVTVTGVDAKSIKSMSFQTATDARSLYIDDITTAGGSYEADIVGPTEATTEDTTATTTTETTTVTTTVETTTEATTVEPTTVTTTETTTVTTTVETTTEATTAETTTEATTEGTTSASASSWTAGDTVPSWLSVSGTVSGTAEKNSNGNVAFSTANGSAFANTIKLAENGTFTITPEKAGIVKVYVAADNNNANKGTLTATIDDKTVGTYSLPGRKDSSANAFEVTVDAANAGKAITFTTSYKALLFKVECN